jgi:transcription initiation factor TFIID subunit 15
MGKIPAVSNMISAMIVEPQVGETVAEDTTFTVRVQTQGLDAGSFTNPTLTYYSAPQDLNNNGDIIGHCHITIQELGNSLNPNNAPDPTTFAFFKGINDNGNGQGLLSAEVTGGLVAGFYRVCTMISSSNHQPGTLDSS